MNHRFMFLALTGLLALVFLAAGLGVAAHAASPSEANAASASIRTYGEPPPRVIFTPKGFDQTAYEKLSHLEKSEVIKQFGVYWEERINGQAGAAGLRAGSGYSKLVSDYSAVSPSEEGGEKYGFTVSFKYRGEKQYEKDKATIKKIINGYGGAPVRVLLIPVRYSYEDTLRIRKELDAMIEKLGKQMDEMKDHKMNDLRIHPVSQFIEALDDSYFGGSYINDDYTISIATVSDVDLQSIFLQHPVTANLGFRYVPVTYTQEQLLLARDKVAKAHFYGVETVGINAKENAIVVFGETFTSKQKRDIEACSPVKNVVFFDSEADMSMDPHRETIQMPSIEITMKEITIVSEDKATFDVYVGDSYDIP